MFIGLLEFEPLFLDVLERDLEIFAQPKSHDGAVPTFENLLLFDEETLSLGLKKGAFSPENDLDLAWVMQYAQDEKTADLEGMDVFEFLAELAIRKAQAQKEPNL